MSNLFEESTSSIGSLVKFKYANNQSFIKVANKLYFSKAVDLAESGLKAIGFATKISRSVALVSLVNSVAVGLQIIGFLATVTAYALSMSIYGKLYEDAKKMGTIPWH